MSTAGEVEIVFRGRDEVSQAITGINGELTSLNGGLSKNNMLMERGTMSTRDLNKVQREMMMEQRVNRRQFMLNNQTFFETTKLIGSVGNAGMKVNSIFLNWNAIKLREATVNGRVADTYKNLQDAITKYGKGSEEAMKADKDYQKALQEQKQLAMEMPGQMLAMGMSFVSLASDIGHVARNYNELRFSVRKGGGITKMLMGGQAASGLPLSGALGGMTGSNGVKAGGGLLGKIGGMKGIGMMGAGAAGLGLTQAFQSGALGSTGDKQGDKLIGTLGSVGSMAMMGMVAGPIGAAVGAGAGLVLGLAQNYGEEFGNLFGGRGFKSNADAGVGQGVTVMGDMNINSAGTTAEAVFEDARRLVRSTARTASPVG